MKALVINGVHSTDMVEREVPVPGVGEVLLKVRVVGFCGSDLNTFRGLNPMVTYPRIPGHEIGGVIESCGPEVDAAWAAETSVLVSPYTSCGTCSACRQGRFNCCRSNQTLGVQRDGAMTEYIAVPQEKLFTSDRLSLGEMALVEPLTVGFHAVGRARVDPGDTVAVFGCGAIGLGAIAGAAVRKARVIAIDVDDEKLALAKKSGAAVGINSMTQDLHEELVSLTDGDGPGVMIEAVGLPKTFKGAVEEVGFAGRVVYIGYVKQRVDYETKFFVQKELDIMGSRNAMPEDFRQVIAMLESGVFPVDDVITSTVPLSEAGNALSDWSEDPAAVTKIHVEV